MSCAPKTTFPKNKNFARGRNSTQHNIWSEYKQLTSGWIPGFCVFFLGGGGLILPIPGGGFYNLTLPLNYVSWGRIVITKFGQIGLGMTV